MRWPHLLIVLVIQACKPENDGKIIYGYEFFPTDEGRFVTYRVTDIFHDVLLSPSHDTTIYEIKEVVGTSFLDDQGEIQQELIRYRRDQDGDPWELKDIWTIKRSSRRAEKLEENKRRIKLAFFGGL